MLLACQCAPRRLPHFPSDREQAGRAKGPAPTASRSLPGPGGKEPARVRACVQLVSSLEWLIGPQEPSLLKMHLFSN